MVDYSPGVEMIRSYLMQAQRQHAEKRAEMDVLQALLIDAETAEDRARALAKADD